MTRWTAARIAVAAFAFAALVSIVAPPSSSATPSIPIPPPLEGTGLRGR